MNILCGGGGSAGQSGGGLRVVKGDEANGNLSIGVDGEAVEIGVEVKELSIGHCGSKQILGKCCCYN